MKLTFSTQKVSTFKGGTDPKSILTHFSPLTCCMQRVRAGGVTVGTGKVSFLTHAVIKTEKQSNLHFDFSNQPYLGQASGVQTH